METENGSWPSEGAEDSDLSLPPLSSERTVLRVAECSAHIGQSETRGRQLSYDPGLEVEASFCGASVWSRSLVTKYDIPWGYTVPLPVKTLLGERRPRRACIVARCHRKEVRQAKEAGENSVCWVLM